MTLPEPYPPVCQPIEAALRQQVEQERLLNQVTTQIRQTLELPVILETAVQQVRQFLDADRLVIYQFDHPERVVDQPLRPDPQPNPEVWLGRVIYEARANETISSVLGWGERDRCFTDPHRSERYYYSGMTISVPDTEVAYTGHPCLLSQVHYMHVRAKLVAPIVIQSQPWGLFIAHQCDRPREWSENEQNFLRHIAEHLAIAIYQAELYAELQKQKRTLEQQVIDRTRALRDTLLAAQSANRAKSEFLANVSHEFRSPLTTVIGMSSTLMRWTFGHLSSQQRHYLQTIHDSGKHLLDLINDVLDLSQLEAGKMALKTREFSLALIAKQVLDMFRDNAEKNEIKFVLEIDNHLVDQNHLQMANDLLFQGDRRRTRQILINLLSNAIKFTPAGGQVTLRVSRDGAEAVLQVEDTGIGIAEDQKSLLFQKFQQLDSSYQRQYPGTGLGLALTKQLVELHNGRIDVDSTLGVGSQFTVWLPELALSGQKDVTKHSQPVRAAQIVLIETDETLASELCDLLTDAGHHVIWMMDGLAAIEQVKFLQPELIVMSMRLSRTNGQEILQQLQELPVRKQLKILALHIQGDLATPDQIPHLADDDLYQPIVASEFLSKINHLLESIRNSSSSA
jgi:two-component system, sensor histidine kinase and response regulator